MTPFQQRTAAAAALILGLAMTPSVAGAATATTTMSISANVLDLCTVSAAPLAFGDYRGVQLDGTSTLSVICTNGTKYDVGLNAGATAGATVDARKMAGPASSTLAYQLYTAAGRTVVWGDTVGTNTVAGTGSGAAQALTVYGRIPAAQFSRAGAYTDTVTVTVTY